MKPEFSNSIPSFRHASVLASGKVRRWLEGLARGQEAGQWGIDQVIIHQAFMFGDDKVGYVVAEAKGKLGDGSRLNGIVFLRGDGVCIIPVLVTQDGTEWTIVVEQPRLAVGASAYVEAVAGMVDEGEVSSKALDELSEETGEDFGLTASDLVEIGRVHPSPGGCDEEIIFYSFLRHVSQSMINSLQGRPGGMVSESESITVRAIPLTNLPIEANQDMKARMGHTMLEEWRNNHGFDSLDVRNHALTP